MHSQVIYCKKKKMHKNGKMQIDDAKWKKKIVKILAFKFQYNDRSRMKKKW